jgi:hypothetical protein
LVLHQGGLFAQHEPGLNSAPPHSSSAEAHLNSTGMGPIYDGFLHFLSSPEDIIPVVALALSSGLRGPECVISASHQLVHRLSIGRTCASTDYMAGGGHFVLGVWGTRGAVLLGMVHGWMNGAGVP